MKKAYLITFGVLVLLFLAFGYYIGASVAEKLEYVDSVYQEQEQKRIRLNTDSAKADSTKQLLVVPSPPQPGHTNPDSL